MASPLSVEDPDSRTSSVGRKRDFNQFVALDNNVVALGDRSSDEDGQHLNKRFRNSEIVERNSVPPPSTPIAFSEFRDVIAIDDSPDSVPSHRRNIAAELPKRIHDPDDVRTQVGGAVQNLLPWNKGIPVEIRTSFKSRSSQAESIFSQSNSPPAPDAQLTVTGVVAPTDLVMPQERSIKGAAAKPRSRANTAVTRVTKSSKKARKLIDWSRVETSLLLSFGSTANREEAKRILQTLPEACRALMPREVPDDALMFVARGQKFKFPRQLHRDHAMSALPKLNFYELKFGFVSRFLQENGSSLDAMDYEFIVQTFRDYLSLLYGHLPERLTQMVGTTKQVTSEKIKRICADAIEQAKELRDPTYLDGTIKRIGLKSDRPELPNTLPESPAEEPGKQSLEYRYKEAHFMGRMLGVKRTQSLMTKSAQFESEDKSFPQPLAADSSMKDDTPSATATKVPLSAQAAPQTPDTINRTEQLEQRQTEADAIEIELLHRYFPSDDKETSRRRCLTCAELGHKTSACPLLTCATCNVRGHHFTDTCPQTLRCTKCYERGHQKSECPEKLAATPGEDEVCDNCNSKNHTLRTCHFLWRSYKPALLKSVRRVAYIPVSCYSCGASGHYGPECGIHKGPLLTEGYTWSKANLSRYIDPESSNRAISDGNDYTLPGAIKAKKNFAIKGIARNVPILVSDDDSDEVSFIGQRVKKQSRPIPKGNVHIKFESTRREENHYAPPFQPERVPSGPRHQQSYLTYPKAERHSRYEDRRPQSYRTQDVSARYRRERTFSPPPRSQDDHYLPRRDDVPPYRPFERENGSFKGRPPLQGTESSRNDNAKRGGPAMRERNGKLKPQRNRKK